MAHKPNVSFSAKTDRQQYLVVTVKLVYLFSFYLRQVIYEINIMKMYFILIRLDYTLFLFGIGRSYNYFIIYITTPNMELFTGCICFPDPCLKAFGHSKI